MIAGPDEIARLPGDYGGWPLHARLTAAPNVRHGYLITSQRDFRTLEALFHKLDPSHAVDPSAIDHHETDWYRDYFRAPTPFK